MMPPEEPGPRFSTWLDALEHRHLANLTVSEVTRALRALSSCYVERRNRLAEGDALAGAGKRAAFALFYAPVHFLVTQRIIRALGAAGVTSIVDIGCGTGAAGAAWSNETGGVPISGFDLHPWAVAEASWSYRVMNLPGRAVRAEATEVRVPLSSCTAIVAAYCVNELPPPARAVLLPRLIGLAGRGHRVLIVEPISRRTTPWWAEWEAGFRSAGGRGDEWRFPATLPERQAQLARGAGLDMRELTARSLLV